MNNSATAKIKAVSESNNTFIVCLALLVLSVFTSKSSAAFSAAFCSLTGIALEYIASKLFLSKNTIDLKGVIADSLLISFLLPTDVPLYVSASAIAFCILVCNTVFGSRYHTPFSGVAGGICFVYTLFYSQCFSESAISSSLLSMLKNGEAVSFNVFNASKLLSGSFSLFSVEACVLALIGVFLFFCVKEKQRILFFVPYIITAAVFVSVFPRINSGAFSSIITELCAGSFIFSGLLILSEQQRLPKSKINCIAYGTVSGLVCIGLRRVSPVIDPTLFGVLIMNALLPLFKVRGDKNA